MFKAGTIEDNLGIPGDIDYISFPVTFSFDSSTAQDTITEQDSPSNVVRSGGNIVCTNISADAPHAGEQFPNAPKVPKAKASGECSYSHVQGTPPNWTYSGPRPFTRKSSAARVQC